MLLDFKKVFKKKENDPNPKLTRFIHQVTGLKPHVLSFYQTAFTHRSLGIKDENGLVVSYERLEFLGDAILGSIIAEYIYNEVPSADEGYLTKMRSKIVSRAHLNELGEELKLLNYLSSQVPRSHFGRNVYGNLFEALVGAVYLDHGYTKCKSFLEQKMIGPYVDIEKLDGKVISYKSLVIEWCQKHKKTFSFDNYEDTGADAQKHFAVKLCIEDQVTTKARATSKKKAEEKASKRAYFSLQKR